MESSPARTPAPAAVPAPAAPLLAPSAARLSVPAPPGARAPRGTHSPLPAAVWRAHEWARPPAVDPRRVLASGFAALDRELPGGGWPRGALTELLLPHEGLGELRLLAPALAAAQQGGGVGGAGGTAGALEADGATPRGLMVFDPPAEPCAWVLAALGLDLDRLVVVRARGERAARPGSPGQPAQARAARGRLPAADILWALEQALRSGELGAVVAWLPARLPADALRRLQLAAQAHPGPAFLLRPLAEAAQPSPAPLRLRLAAAGPDRLAVLPFKRRGRPAAEPVRLDLAPVLPPPLPGAAHAPGPGEADAALADGGHGGPGPAGRRAAP